MLNLTEGKSNEAEVESAGKHVFAVCVNSMKDTDLTIYNRKN